MNNSDEREFLHDIANPLAAAMILIELVVEGLQTQIGSGKVVSEEELKEELAQAAKAGDELLRMRKILSERREILIARGVPSKPSAPS